MNGQRRLSIAILACLILLSTAARSELPPIFLMHRYLGQAVGDGIYTWNFELMIQNPTDATIYGVELGTDQSITWLPASEAVNLVIGEMAAREIRKVPLSIRTVAPLDENILRDLPLTWWGQYSDPGGLTSSDFVDSFPSMEGGAQ